MIVPAPGRKAAAPPDPAPGTVRLRILATTDLHMHLLPWDYYTDRPARQRGLSLLAGLIAQARAETPHCLLLDNGDFLQGSPIGDFLAETVAYPAAELHPMIAAMNHLRYDAACLGNHEFSHGLPFLQRALQGADFAALSANILTARGRTPAQDQPLFAPSALIRRTIPLPGQPDRALTIGLVGLTPPQVVSWERQVLGGQLEVRSMQAAAAHHLADLRRRGADIVIALAHSGLGDAGAPGSGESAVARLARDLNFDAFIAGHVHSTFPGSDIAPGPGIDPQRGLVFGKPTVMPGFNGSHLGVIDLDLAALPGAGWRVTASTAALRAVSRRSASGRIIAAAPEDAQLRKIALPAHAMTRRWAGRKIGQTPVPLHSYFALVGPCASVRLIAEAQAAATRQILRGSLWEGLPVLSAAAPFRAGGRSGPDNYTFVPPGPISLRNIADLYAFPNTLVGLLLTGAEIAEWLERSAAQFNRIAPGSQGSALINPEMPGFDFDHIHGLTYGFDLSVPARYDASGRRLDSAARRLAWLRHEGAPVDPAARFVLASNSYRLGGGGGYAMAREARVILRGGPAIRALLAAHVSVAGSVPADPPPEWGFAPMKGTSATFTSAAGAGDHIGAQDRDRIRALDLTENGFRRFRLTLG